MIESQANDLMTAIQLNGRRLGKTDATVALALEKDIPVLAANTSHAEQLKKCGAKVIGLNDLRGSDRAFVVDHYTYESIINGLLQQLEVEREAADRDYGAMNDTYRDLTIDYQDLHDKYVDATKQIVMLKTLLEEQQRESDPQTTEESL